MDKALLKAAAASQTGIFARAIDASAPRPEVAEALLRITFTEADQARMQDLAARNQRLALAKDEMQELENYIQVNNLLGVLHLKARVALDKNGRSGDKKSVAR